MIPKISVSPLATRNSSRPYWTAFRHWTRKVGRSTAAAPSGPAQRRPKRKRRAAKPPAELCRRLQLAAARRIRERLHRHPADLVVVALGFAQVDVLHRVACRRDRELAARAVDHD